MSTSPDGPPPDRPRPSPRPGPGPVPRSGPATAPGARGDGGRHRFDGLAKGNPVTEGMSNTRQISNVYLGARKRVLPLVAFVSVLTALAQAGALVIIAAAAVALAKDERTVKLSAGPVSFSLGLTVATIISVACAVLMITLQLTAGRMTAALAKTAESACRDRAIQAYLRASWEVVSPRERGELQQIMTINVDRVARVVVYRAVWIFGIANLVILVGSAFFLAPLLAIIMIVMAALFAVPLRPIKNRTRKAAGDHSDAERGFATYVAGLVEQARESRVFDVGDALADKGHVLNVRAAEGQRRVQFLVWTTPAIYLGGALLSLAVAIAALAAIGTSHLESIGPMVLLLLRSLVYGQTALSSTQFLVEAAPYLRELEKHVALYQAEVQSTGTRSAGPIQRLQLASAGYQYPGSPTPALQGVDLDIAAGTAIGIVGSTGSGKSTLAEVLLALRPVSSGRYLVNGIDASEIASSDWAHRVGYVPQQSVIFDGTLRENIRFYRPSITDAEVERAARDAHIDAEIRAMPEGYDTVVAGLSVGLSGGQRQRICIARALAGRPEILVMDEPTSGLDVRSENLFVETIQELKGRTTLLIIAHRLETIRMCDRVVVVTDGHVVDEDPTATGHRLDGYAPVNGHTNGHANGHVNGHTHGHTPVVEPVLPVRPRPSARR